MFLPSCSVISKKSLNNHCYNTYLAAVWTRLLMITLCMILGQVIASIIIVGHNQHFCWNWFSILWDSYCFRSKKILCFKNMNKEYVFEYQALQCEKILLWKPVWVFSETEYIYRTPKPAFIHTSIQIIEQCHW